MTRPSPRLGRPARRTPAAVAVEDAVAGAVCAAAVGVGACKEGRSNAALFATCSLAGPVANASDVLLLVGRSGRTGPRAVVGSDGDQAGAKGGAGGRPSMTSPILAPSPRRPRPHPLLLCFVSKGRNQSHLRERAYREEAHRSIRRRRPRRARKDEVSVALLCRLIAARETLTVVLGPEVCPVRELCCGMASRAIVRAHQQQSASSAHSARSRAPPSRPAPGRASELAQLATCFYSPTFSTSLAQGPDIHTMRASRLLRAGHGHYSTPP
jgi:hypothetical protein